jgi:tetratricopeptide (TPR) repeat protein
MPRPDPSEEATFVPITAPVLTSLLFAASAAAQPAPDLAPADTVAYSRGVEAENAGRHDEAILDLTWAIALMPTFAGAYASRGVAYDQKGLYDRAIADYTRALALENGAVSTTIAETYFNRGAAYEHRRLYPRALTDYRTALGLDPHLQAAQAGVKRLSKGR